MKGKVWNITDTADLKQAAAEVLDSRAKVLALYGDLGAGKTTFTQALGQLLGVSEEITSPTFVIMKRYATTNGTWRSLIHIDAYRLHSSEELEVLGFSDWLQEPETLVVIEWAERVEPLLPPTTTRLRFMLKGDERTLELQSHESEK